MMSSASQHVEIAKAISCKNCIVDGDSGEDPGLYF